MPSKKDSLSYHLREVRKTAQRRVERLSGVIANKSIPQHIRNWAVKQRQKIQGAMQRTKTVNKEGKCQAWKTDAYRKKAGNELIELIKDVPALYNPSGTSDFITQQQLNLASSKKTEAASIYSFEEKTTFYAVTRDIWQREGITDKERNQAIVDYFNKNNTGRPRSLKEIVDEVLKKNKEIKESQKLDPSKKMTKEQREMYEKYAGVDTGDGEKKSPTQGIVDAIIDSLRDLFNLPENGDEDDGSPYDFTPEDE